MARRSTSDPNQIAHQVDFRLDSAFYTFLGQVAKDEGLVRADGKARTAELIRVLIISVLRSNRPVRDRVAIALYCNSVLTLSGRLTAVLADLRNNVAAVANIQLPPPEEKEPKSPKKKDRPGVVSIVLDDLLRRMLTYRLQADIPRLQQEGLLPDDLSNARPTPDIVLVRYLLLQAQADFAQHRPVIRAYATRMQRIEETLRAAVVAGQEAVETALQEG